MRNLNQYVIERLRINKDISPIKYNYQPKDFDELRSLLEQLFEERGKDADLNDIDVSEITSFGNEITTGKYKGYWGLFYGLDPHNIKIDKWDVSNVEDMSNLFYNCENFIGHGLEKWKVNKVKDMERMFYECKNFNCDLSDWDVSNVKYMVAMFFECKNFTGQGLENWKPLKCRNMYGMMYGCASLKNKLSWYKG